MGINDLQFNIAAARMAERLRALFLNHSIISPLCLVSVRPRTGHLRQAKLIKFNIAAAPMAASQVN